MKCLIVTKQSVRHPEAANDTEEAMTSLYASLQALGIKHRRAVAEVMPSDAYVNSFDFIVFPQFAVGYSSVVDDSGITIPMMALAVTSAASGMGATPGVSGSRSTLADQFLTVPWSNEPWICGYTGAYTLTTGTALATIAAQNARTGAAQTNAGQVAAWSTVTAGGSRLYVSAFKAINHAMLPFLVQAAIDDGELSSPPKRAPIVVDLDHINGSYSHLEPELLDKIASYVPAGGVIWAGIFNGAPAYFQNMSATVQTKLQQYSGKPFKYCWHDHVFSPLIVTGIWPSTTNLDADGYSTDVSKSEQNTRYLADKTTWESKGLTFHQPAYYNSGSNSWDNASLELFSYKTGKQHSVANDTTQAGYGFTVFRAITACPRAPAVRTALYYNQWHNKRKMHGIQIINTFDAAFGNAAPNANTFDMPFATDAKWRNSFHDLCNAVTYGQSIYFHDEDFLSAYQEPGVKQHGYVVMQIIADAGAYLKDVAKAFADPTEYVSKINYI